MIQDRLIAVLARELQVPPGQVQAAARLLDEGNTVPFIARYRKEATGGLKDDQLRTLQERLGQLRSLAERQAEVARLIDGQGKLTPGLSAAIEAAQTLTEVEDLYRPYRPKRRTRASMARDKGLEPLADLILNPAAGAADMAAAAREFVNEQVTSAEEALQGARDIIAERVADDPAARRLARELTMGEGAIVSQAAGNGGEQAEGQAVAVDRAQGFEMYFGYREPLVKLPPHRVLAINRGEKKGALSVRIQAPDEMILNRLQDMFVRRVGTSGAAQVREAVRDGYKRLLAPAVERDIRAALTEKAEEQAIRVFGQNLHHLLLQPPVRGHRVLGVDPGFRTGCKLAAVDATGKVLATGTAHITAAGQARIQAGEALILSLIRGNGVTLVAIGNGTASRETEQAVARIIARLDGVRYLIVSEAGASVYSASPLASEEFPDLDVSLRGAVSIARRVLDPLAELVKIDPKHIGVGQYQHDVDQKRLSGQVNAVVESAVNSVGVDLNTASAALLNYVSGLKMTAAKAIVARRERRGPFRSRRELLEVAGLGERTFVQCAGFLRIADGDNPLDNTPIHPESYHVAEALMKAAQPPEQADPVLAARELGVGLSTVRDIIEALRRPGRDPRDDWPQPVLRSEVIRLEDLRPGMELEGTVSNVVDFGVFVDIGVHQDGLVHISELSQRFVRHPSEAVSVGDLVRVRVLNADERRQRISLTMKLPAR